MFSSDGRSCRVASGTVWKCVLPEPSPNFTVGRSVFRSEVLTREPGSTLAVYVVSLQRPES